MPPMACLLGRARGCSTERRVQPPQLATALPPRIAAHVCMWDSRHALTGTTARHFSTDAPLSLPALAAHYPARASPLPARAPHVPTRLRYICCPLPNSRFPHARRNLHLRSAAPSPYTLPAHSWSCTALHHDNPRLRPARPLADTHPARALPIRATTTTESTLAPRPLDAHSLYMRTIRLALFPYPGSQPCTLRGLCAAYCARASPGRATTASALVPKPR
ncbi:hypothetical protein C8J57DRAFT_1665652, partial [Mycena rebaudengoi]